MAFDSKDTAAFKGVWVFCEQREGVIMSISYQLLSEGRKLANDLGVELCGVVLGKDIKEDYLKALGGYGADKVYYCNHELLDVYTTDAYTKVICDLVEDKKPEIFLIGATNIGRDLGPRCAARLHTGLCADCTHLDVDMGIYKDFLREASTLAPEKIDALNTAIVLGEKHDVSRDLKMTRPAFGGHLMASIICPRFRPAMATVRPGVMKKAPFDQAKADACEIIKPEFSLTEDDMETQVVEVVKAAKKLVDLIGADVVVSVGRGISKDVERGIQIAEELADALAALGLDTAFDPARADLSGLGTTESGAPLFISSVAHQAKIEVNEEGTEAAAATVVEVRSGGPAPMDYEELILDRPFCYAIVDLERGVPLFLGTFERP